MNRISLGVTRHKTTVTLIFILAAILSAILQFGVRANYNMVDYLPEDAQSTRALKVMDAEFAQAVPNARVMLRDVTIQQALEYKRQLKSIDGVSDVLWLDDVIDLRTPVEMADPDTVDDYYSNGSALISLSVAEGRELEVTEAIYGVIGEDHALSGNALDTAVMQQLASHETTNAMLILVPVVLLILVLSTGSWAEPLLFIASIGVSVLISMGTNLFLGEISFITRTISPILQLAVSLDYAIFLLHSFDDYRKQTDDVEQAMQLAIRRAFPAIAASAATTLFGFIALVFMNFEIGADLGINLAKGIVLSFVSVLLFLPALTLSCYKLIDKTRHRRIMPEFKTVGRIIPRIRIPALILVALLIVPCFLAQRSNSFTYGYSALSPDSRSGLDTDAINAEFGQSTAIVLLVPNDSPAIEEMLCSELGQLEHVTEVVSYTTMVGASIPQSYIDSAITSRFYSENYCRIILYTDTAEEGGEAFGLVQSVQAKAAEYYGDAVYSCGRSVNLYDMKNVVTKDNKLVSFIAVTAIFMVLLLTFKSISLPILLVLTIETAIWINLSSPYFSGNPLCYIGYLIINTVQLGATVDYAILLSDHYIANRKTMPVMDTLKATLSETFGSILVSALILSLAGFCLWLTSSNSIVSELGLLLGRGTILSMLMVVCFLPAALALFDKVIEKTTLRTVFFKETSL